MPLTSRDAVLNNIEVGWNQRKPSAIDDLLDENFTFYFDPGDVGGDIPSSWNRATDLAATTALLQSNTVPPGSAPVCERVVIALDLDGLIWTEVPVIASISTLTETWYSTIVSYSANFEMEGDNIYITVPGAKAQLTVREVEGGWRLVEWRDLAGQSGATASSRDPSASTWGKIKAIYR